MENKYQAIIEAIGEILINKDEKIKYQQYEIEALKQKVKLIEESR